MPTPRHLADEERRARLVSRQLPAHRWSSVAEAVTALTCLHATEPASVYLSVLARADVSFPDVDTALYDDRWLVKQLAMRRTVFAFPRPLLPAVWGSAAARVATQQRDRLARDVIRAGITDDGERWVAEHTAAVLDLLTERGPMTTMELRAELPALDARMTYSADKSYGATVPIAPRVLTTLAASGEILRGDNAGGWKTSRPRWTPASAWLGEPVARLDAVEGYAALVAAWLRTFGPGTEDDIVWWLGATRSAVRRALADVQAVEVRVDAGVAYVLPDDADPVPPVAPSAALLPALDPTTMGWKHRAFYLGPHARALFDSNGNAGPTAWWDGRIVGGWHQAPDGEVRILPAEELGAEAASALAGVAERLTGLLGGDVVNTIYQSPLVRGIG